MARQHNSKETTELIINSAIENFLEKGYSKTTLEDIVQRVGLTRGAFYWNFKCKKEILDEIVNRYEKFYLDIYDNYEQSESARSTLRNLLIRDISKKVTGNPYMVIIRYKVEASAEVSDLIERQGKLDDLFIGIIEKEIARGIENGEFSSSVNAREGAVLIFTYLLGFDNYLSVHLSDSEKDTMDKAQIERVVDMMLKVLG